MNNDFKKNYKNEMDKVMPSSESIERLTDAMTEKKSRRISPRALRRVIAIAACVAILAGAALPIGLSMRDGKAPAGLSPIDLIKPSQTLDQVNLTSYDEIYDIVSAAAKKYYAKGDGYFLYAGGVGDAIDINNSGTLDGLDTMAPTATMPVPEIKDPTANRGDNDYYYSAEDTDTPEFSDTNLQEAGVQEADIIKTDGKYIYALSNKYLHIVKAENGALTLLAKISRMADDSASAPTAVREMYVAGDRLIVIKNIYEKVEVKVTYTPGRNPYFYYSEDTAASADTVAKEILLTPDTVGEVEISYPEMQYQYIGMGAEIYDISEKSAPKLVNTLTQDGYYVSSRMIGDVLYLITDKGVYKDGLIAEKPETFVPTVDGDLIAPECIYIARDTDSITGSNYLVVSGIDTAEEGEIVSTSSIFGFGSNVYCSADSLYITAGTTVKKDDIRSNATRIFKFSLDGGKVAFVSEGTVPGTVLNQFSLDEENGYLRLVTTFQSWRLKEVQNGEYTYMSQSEYKKCNCLYVLESDLSVVGKLEDLAPDEQIYSARFEGDIAYFVTFRQTDPLFTVDLSDVTAPKILSELKIPGFSEYLHPWSDGLLFGFGKYANPNTGIAGDLKLSMFDVSDKTDVSEAHTLTLYGNAYSAASYNHKAILINAGKNIIAFPTENNCYLVYSYDSEKGFEKKAEIGLVENVGAYNYYAELRGLFIGEYLYVYSPVGIASYNMNDYSFAASVNLD